MAEVLRVHLSLTKIKFLPAGIPPHKPEQVLTPAADRLAMLELAIGDVPHFSVCTIDIERDGPSYTADTLEILRRDLLEESELYFLMGHDSLRDFPRWHEPWRIVQHARLGVAKRPGVNVSMDDVFAAVPQARGRVEIVDVPLIGVSSSDIRDAVAHGGPFRFQVPLAVANYITEHGLYREQSSTSPRKLTSPH